MNTLTKYSLVILLSFGASSISLAAFIDDTNAGIFDGADVGDTDILLKQDDKVNGEAAELAWVNDYFFDQGITTTFTIKNGDVSYYSTTDTDVYAFHFDPAPGDDFFIIKKATRIALFQNLANFDWGVFDTSLFMGKFNLPSSDSTISHVSQFNDPNDPPGDQSVPEPTSLLQMGLGFLGFCGASRKKA